MRGGVLQPELRSSSSARVSLSKKNSPGAARLFAWAALLCGGAGNRSFPWGISLISAEYVIKEAAFIQRYYPKHSHSHTHTHTKKCFAQGHFDIWTGEGLGISPPTLISGQHTLPPRWETKMEKQSHLVSPPRCMIYLHYMACFKWMFNADDEETHV